MRLQWRLLAFQLYSTVNNYTLKWGQDIPDGVVSAKTDPVRDGAVLLHLLAQGALGLERLKGRLQGR